MRVGGHDPLRDPDAVRAGIGVTGQFAAVDAMLTGEGNLLLMADLHHLGRREGRRRAAELLGRFELTGAAKKLPAACSGGMRRRLDIAMTLVGDPRTLFLDEPTTGLDPRGRHATWRIVRELVAGGVTVLLTTQYLEEADQLADRIGVLNGGRIVADGSPEELKRLVPGGHVRLRFADPVGYERTAGSLREMSRDDTALTLHVPSDGSSRELRSLLDRLDAESIEAESLTVHTPDLDDVFSALTSPTGSTDTPTSPDTADSPGSLKETVR